MTPEAIKILADAVSDFAQKLLLMAEAMGQPAPSAEAAQPCGDGSVSETETDNTEAAPPPADAAAEPGPEQPGYTEDDVRRVLGKKSQAGFTAKCKALISKYGASTVSTLDPKHYAAIISEAEAIK